MICQDHCSFLNSWIFSQLASYFILKRIGQIVNVNTISSFAIISDGTTNEKIPMYLFRDILVFLIKFIFSYRTACAIMIFGGNFVP